MRCMVMDQLTIAHRFAAAFNARDVEQVIEVFAPDIAYHDLFYGTHSGHADLRILFERMYAEGARSQWMMRTTTVSGPRTVGEWSFEFTFSDRAACGAGRTLRYDGISVFETRDGRCHTYREYFDRTETLFAAGFAAESVGRIVRRRPSVQVELPNAEAR